MRSNLYKTIAAIAFVICSQALLAQINLVANPSFESYNMCPNSFSSVAAAGEQQDYVHEWIRPTNGTPDYFNACAAHASVPYNFCGYQQAADGKAYCGLFVFATDDTTTNDYVYREYLLGRLISPLVKEKVYCISFYASPGESLTASYKDYMYATKEMGLYVSVDPPIAYDSITPSHAPELPYTPQIVNQHGVMSDTSRWYRISGTYTAQGGERWITIGNFEDDVQTEGSVLLSEGIPQGFQKMKSYYYIDKVSVFLTEGVKVLPGDLSVCESNFPVSLTANPDLDYYHWNTGSNTQQTDATAAGTYTLETSMEGCPILDSIVVKSEPPPVVDLGPDVDNCVNGIAQPQTLQNNTPLDDYSWSTGAQSDRIDVSETGDYSLTTEHVCGTFTDEVHVSGCEPALYVPNVFAPGSSGANAYFKPFGENVQFEHLAIYNQWGILVYREDNPLQGWDGTFRKQACPPGVYMWLLTYRTFVGPDLLKKYGDVTLIR